MAHTPGPWRWVPGEGNELAQLVGEDEVPVCDFGACYEFNDQVGGTEPSIDDQALMAAAPDLLAACKQVLRDEMGIEDTELYDILQAAIAKAEAVQKLDKT